MAINMENIPSSGERNVIFDKTFHPLRGTLRITGIDQGGTFYLFVDSNPDPEGVVPGETHLGDKNKKEAKTYLKTQN